MRTRIIIMWLSAALLTLFFSGCTRNGGADIGTRPTVTVSIPPQAFLLQKIAGNSLNINTMLPPGADAESYEPSMQAQRSLEESGEYAMVGTLPFEESMAPKLKNIYPQLVVSRTFVCAHPHHHHDEGEEHHHDHEGDDPHVWTTPRQLQIMADTLLQVAVRANPALRNQYVSNHTALSRELTRLQQQMTNDLSPLRGQAVVIWHPSLSFLAREYGFRQTAIQDGHKEPSPRQMADVVDEVKAHGAVAFFIEQEHSPRMAEALNADLQLPLIKTSLMQPDIIRSLYDLSRQLNSAYSQQSRQ